MDIMELGAVGELVGGLAVIASLVYVGLQVRQGAEQARQSNSIERARANREVTRAANEILIQMGDEDFLHLYRAALADFDSLSNNQKSLVHSRFLVPMGVHLTSTFLAARDGLVDKEWADEWMTYWTMVVTSPGISSWWNHIKTNFQPDFAREVERLISSDGAPPPISDLLPWFALESEEGV